MGKFLLAVVLLLSFQLISFAQSPSAYGPVPSEGQLAWQEMEFYAFVHFNMNTFTDEEWGFGDASPELFNPTELDARQWVRLAKKAGMQGIIITAKHHDGFSLWPSDHTEYDVENSPWKNGQGDVLKELRKACDEYGLKMGVYLSPWDRNHPDYGKPEYLTYFRNQLRELLTGYGEIFEVWFDGANGGTGYYGGARENRQVDRKTYYQWEETFQLVHKLQPNAVIFSDGGPDVRWVGTEEGFANKTNWSLLNRDEVWPGWPHYVQLRSGHEDGSHWVPAEVNTSIRPGWYYHPSEDHKVKSLPQLLDIYYQSVGRNGTLLLNLPVDPRGLVHEADSARLMQFAHQIRMDFDKNLAAGQSVVATHTRHNSNQYAPENVIDGDPETYWTTNDDVIEASLTINFKSPQYINRFLVQEYIRLGQRVRGFTVEAFTNEGWVKIAEETTIGYKRILRFPDVKTDKVRFSVTDSKACPVISNIELYRAPKILSEPELWRTKDDSVHIVAADPDVAIYYTADGSIPETDSKRYNHPFHWPRKGTVRAIVVDEYSGESSPVALKEFDIGKSRWTLVSPKAPSEETTAIWDGRASTSWGFETDQLPGDWIIDLGETYMLNGLSYLPDQGRWATGIAERYTIHVSTDNKKWQLAAQGEFSNIRNNPISQKVGFSAIEGRYVKFAVTRVLDDTRQVRIAELEIHTE